MPHPKTDDVPVPSSDKKHPDQDLHTDGEQDTLYDDGLELEDDSRPLKGINGKDDT